MRLASERAWNSSCLDLEIPESDAEDGKGKKDDGEARQCPAQELRGFMASVLIALRLMTLRSNARPQVIEQQEHERPRNSAEQRCNPETGRWNRIARKIRGSSTRTMRSLSNKARIRRVTVARSGKNAIGSGISDSE